MLAGISEVLELFGALGLFLFGMKVMSDALLDMAGNRMRSVLAGLTSNRFKGIGTGFLITSIIQSSSATTLMVVGFANAALLTLPQAISVIMGANIGTTVTAWLITVIGFKVSMGAMALPAIGTGFFLVVSKKEKWRHLGGFIVGFGLLFLGLDLLRDYLPDLNRYPGALSFIRHYTDFGFGSVLMFLLLGTLLTVLLQSSSATMALTLVMTSEGWIPFELACALVLGENVGTTITANLAAFMGNYRAKQTALAHLMFNIFGVVWMLVLLGPFLQGIKWFVMELGGNSPFSSRGDVPVAISIFHTAFNIANTFLLVWLLKPMSRLIVRLVPQRVSNEKEIEEPKFLTDQAMQYPQTAIAAIEQETSYLLEHAIFEIIAHALHLHRKDIFSDEDPELVVHASRDDLKANVRELYLTKVKRIYSIIIAFSTRAQSRLHLSEEQHRRISELKQANRLMVEVLRNTADLNRNVSKYLVGSSEIMSNRYDLFRRRMVWALRSIANCGLEEDSLRRQAHFEELELWVKTQAEADNLEIDGLIRDEAISPEMATSLLNDSDNIVEIIKNLLIIAKLLYAGNTV